jgi:SAM-dependent methyltransferase
VQQDATMPSNNAARKWSSDLHAWAIPGEILDAAPESPWWFPVEVFAEHARHASDGPLTATHRRMSEALPDDGSGTILDVGCGAGAASLPLAPPARRVVGVDSSVGMLQAFSERAGDGVQIETVLGQWLDVADQLTPADVTVCANVLYNVSDQIEGFVNALSGSARRRVVVELTGVHPMTVLNPLWRHFWGLERPEGPTAADAEAVIREVTAERVFSERWTRAAPYLAERGPEGVALARRRLCLPASADAEVASLLADLPSDGVGATSVTLWWKGSGNGGSSLVGD